MDAPGNMKKQTESKQGQGIGHGTRIIWSVFLAGAVVLLGVLSYFSYQADALDWDKPFIHWYQSKFDLFGWDRAMKAVSWVGGDLQWGAFTIGIAFIWLITRKRLAAAFTLSSVAAFGTNAFIKTIVDRPRPTSEAVQVLQGEDGLSFPSGHVATYTALFGITFFLVTRYVNNLWLKRVLQVILGAMIFLIGPSRMTLGVHWPSDVGGGYLVGAIYLLIAVPLFIFLSRRAETQSS